MSRVGLVLVGIFSLILNNVRLDVPLYDQTVEYRTACESVATVACLNYLGYDITIDEFLDEYLDTVGEWDKEVFELSDVFDHYFVGNPRASSGLLCNPPVIVNGVANYFSDIGEDSRSAYDISGVGLNFLLDEVTQGYPVIIWVTHAYEVTEMRSWYGSNYFARSHTVVLSGYDRERGVVYITDSVSGFLELSYIEVKNCFDFCGKRAVVIK